MLAKSGLKKCGVSGLTIALLLVLLNVVLLVLNNTLIKLELSARGCPRKLAEKAQQTNNTNAQSCTRTDLAKKKKKKKNEMPIGGTKNDVTIYLSKKQINKLVKSCSCFVNKDKIYSIYYYYLKCKISCYLKMMSKIKKNFYKMCKQEEIPNDIYDLYWTECKKKLFQHLREMKCSSRWQTFTFLNKSVITNYSLNVFLENFENIWNTNIDVYGCKAAKFLEKKVDDYISLRDIENSKKKKKKKKCCKLPKRIYLGRKVRITEKEDGGPLITTERTYIERI
ncbi:RAD protein [Plasmodium malariae]|uniref:RAD protein n=1 Tax=Plasmodium malariae TaxID=5858 RepID=A0A1D3JLD3_PLAMA|nr:RAD protein [Plasmodium malariae]SBT87411.1 RAD protein [Plasmodium malariae]